MKNGLSLHGKFECAFLKLASLSKLIFGMFFLKKKKKKWQVVENELTAGIVEFEKKNALLEINNKERLKNNILIKW